MFEAYKAKKRAEKEAQKLAEYRALDADVGIPTVKTLGIRLANAALENMWDVVDDCLAKGMPRNVQVSVSEARRFPPLARVLESDYRSSETSLLGMALLHGNHAAARKLLAAGCDPDDGIKTSYKKFSPLYIAVTCGDAEAVQMLCDNGASLDSPKPLHLAESRGARDIIKIIRAEEEKRAQNAAPPNPATPEARAALESISKLPEASREWLIASLREKFPAPPSPVTIADVPAPEGLKEDVVVQKPLTLKKQA